MIDPMRESILNFNKQFLFKPEIINLNKISNYKKVVLIGMGGSHLASDLVNYFTPNHNLIIHSDYGLPNLESRGIKNSEVLFIFSSYSGNTEEVLDSYNELKKRGGLGVVIASGGKLLENAKRDKSPYIALPSISIQPRMALGYSLIALYTLLNDKTAIRDLIKMSQSLSQDKYETKGKVIAKNLLNKNPIIYSNHKNQILAHMAKIIFNETAKIPAFNNIFPESNHNELAGFSYATKNNLLTNHYTFLMLRDESESIRVLKRFKVFQIIMKDRGGNFIDYELKKRENKFSSSFEFILTISWAAHELAQYYKHDPNVVPFIEEFKSLLRK